MPYRQNAVCSRGRVVAEFTREARQKDSHGRSGQRRWRNIQIMECSAGNASQHRARPPLESRCLPAHVTPADVTAPGRGSITGITGETDRQIQYA
jgi:hypothetical protein